MRICSKRGRMEESEYTFFLVLKWSMHDWTESSGVTLLLVRAERSWPSVMRPET